MSSSTAAEILEHFNRDRLTERGRDTFDRIALKLAEGHKYEEIEIETGLTKREQVKRMNELRVEMKAIQDGPALAPLNQEDFDTLKESIRQHGQVVPILRGRDGTIIDGNNRLKACEELGIEAEFKDLEVEGDTARALGFVVNLTRRHLTSSQRQELVVQELLHDPEASDRSIAIGLGVSPTTVGAARRRLEERGSLSRMDSRRGRDGRSQRVPDLDREPKDLSLDNRLASIAAQLKMERGQRIVLVAGAIADKLLDPNESYPLVRVTAEEVKGGLLDLIYTEAGSDDGVRLSTAASQTELAAIRAES